MNTGSHDDLAQQLAEVALANLRKMVPPTQRISLNDSLHSRKSSISES